MLDVDPVAVVLSSSPNKDVDCLNPVNFTDAHGQRMNESDFTQKGNRGREGGTYIPVTHCSPPTLALARGRGKRLQGVGTRLVARLEMGQ